MITAATKYTAARRLAAAPKGSSPSPRPSPPGEGDKGVSVARVPMIFVPSASSRRVMLMDWWWKEIKEGGFLHTYVQREKAKVPTMLRQVARVMAGFKQNNKSDFRLVASVPARLAHRLKAEDPDFFADNQNLKNLRRDNPDVVVKL